MKACSICEKDLGQNPENYRCIGGYVCDECYIKSCPSKNLADCSVDEIREAMNKIDSDSADSIDLTIEKLNTKIKRNIIILCATILVFILCFVKCSSGNSDEVPAIKENTSLAEPTTTTLAATTTTTTTTKTTTKTTTTKSEAELKLQAQKEKTEYIAECVEISYSDLARNPNKYIGEKLKITVEVKQVLTGSFSKNAYRCYEDYDIRSGDTYLDNEWYIEYYFDDENESRILNNDVVTFYGVYEGTSALERALTGVTDYVPTLSAEYFEISSYTSTTTTTGKAVASSTTEAQKIISSPSSVNDWGYYGTGDNVLSGLSVTNYGILAISHSGEHYFSVKLHNNDTGDSDLLVNEIGSYNGVVLIPESGNYDIEVNADGNWEINANKIDLTEGSTFSGSGDAVTSIFYTQNHNWHITNSNSNSYFSVKSYYVDDDNDRYDLLVSEIGNYSGTVRADKSGNMFFEIKSDGSWTIAPAN